jgi:arsenite methyltransferase
VLDRLPAAAVESFAGVGHPFVAGEIEPGDVVLDIGSGSGLLIAALAAGSDGRAIGLDMTRAMREKAAANVRALSLDNVEVVDGNAEAIPLPDASVDVVTSNGVINLIPDKAAVAREIHRVLRPNGRVQIADIVVRELPSEQCRSNPELWAECIVGATTGPDYLDTFRAAGFDDVEQISKVACIIDPDQQSEHIGDPHVRRRKRGLVAQCADEF